MFVRANLLAITLSACFLAAVKANYSGSCLWPI